MMRNVASGNTKCRMKSYRVRNENPQFNNYLRNPSLDLLKPTRCWKNESEMLLIGSGSRNSSEDLETKRTVYIAKNISLKKILILKRKKKGPEE